MVIGTEVTSAICLSTSFALSTMPRRVPVCKIYFAAGIAGPLGRGSPGLSDNQANSRDPKARLPAYGLRTSPIDSPGHNSWAQEKSIIRTSLTHCPPAVIILLVTMWGYPRDFNKRGV